MWGCTKGCTWDCTWDSTVVAFCGPVAALKSAIDGGLNVGFKWPILFESNWGCTIKRQRGCTWRFAWFNYKHFSAVESAPDGSSEDISTFEVEIKGAL